MNCIIYAKTNAEFLNEAFGTNYVAWMKSRWEYDQDTWVWMVRFDGRIRQDWANRIISETEIWEEYVGNEEPTYRSKKEKKYRIVVQILEGRCGREYHTLGKFKYDYEKSTIGRHVLIKV